MSRPLNKRQRAFADAWNGLGSGTEAARIAGYKGSPKVLQVQASHLLRHPGVIARIEERLGRPLADLMDPAPPPDLPPSPPPAPGGALKKGKGRGTPTERIELLMEIGRDKKAPARDRINAILAAAELEGERRPGRPRATPPAPITAPAPPPPALSERRKLTLVLSESDQKLAEEDGPDG